MSKPQGPGRIITKDVTYIDPPVNFKDTSIPPTREKKTSGIEAIINTPKSKMPINA
jgi:hypothetical protein